MKKLSNTLYYQYDNSIVNALKIVPDPQTDFMNNEQLSDFLYDISKRSKSPYTNLIAANLEKGLLKFTCDERMMKIPLYLPILVYPAYSLINLSHLTKTCEKNKPTNVKFNQMLGLAAAASIMRSIIMNPEKYKKNTKILGFLAKTYATMVSKAIDKAYAINLDPLINEQIKYLCAKYFLVNLLEMPSNSSLIDTIPNVVVNQGQASVGSVKSIDILIPDDMFDSLPVFINGLAKLFPGKLTGATPSVFISNIARMFSERAMLAFDYFPYLVANIIFFHSSSMLNNEFGWDKILATTDLNNFVIEVLRLASEGQ